MTCICHDKHCFTGSLEDLSIFSKDEKLRALSNLWKVCFVKLSVFWLGMLLRNTFCVLMRCTVLDQSQLELHLPLESLRWSSGLVVYPVTIGVLQIDDIALIVHCLL